jgi:8-oxo-dGTP diphosphatase
MKKKNIGIIVILKKSNNILLGKRLTKHGFKEWGLVGGHLELEETIEECAIREVKEETNIKINNPKFITKIKVNFPNGKRYESFVFLSETKKEPKNNEPEKLENWKWFKWNNLPRPLFLPVKKIQEKKILEKIFEK